MRFVAADLVSSPCCRLGKSSQPLKVIHGANKLRKKFRFFCESQKAPFVQRTRLQPERRGIPDRTTNTCQRVVRKFQRHECLGGKRARQVACLLRREAKSGVVLFVSEHDDNTFTPIPEFSQSAKNQFAANLTALMVRENGQRSQ